MKPKAMIAIGLIFTLVAGPAGAQAQTTQQATPPPQSTPTPTPSPSPTPSPGPTQATGQTATISADSLDRIRGALSREPAFRVEEGQLRIYVQVIGHWATFAEVTKGYDFMNGPTGFGNPMSHAEFVAMSTPRDLYSSAGIRPAEVLTMAAVGVVGQWALAKAIDKWSTSRRDKKLKEIHDQIEAELAALQKAKEIKK